MQNVTQAEFQRQFKECLEGLSKFVLEDAKAHGSDPKRILMLGMAALVLGRSTVLAGEYTDAQTALAMERAAEVIAKRHVDIAARGEGFTAEARHGTLN